MQPETGTIAIIVIVIVIVLALIGAAVYYAIRSEKKRSKDALQEPFNSSSFVGQEESSAIVSSATVKSNSLTELNPTMSNLPGSNPTMLNSSESNPTMLNLPGSNPTMSNLPGSNPTLSNRSNENVQAPIALVPIARELFKGAWATCVFKVTPSAQYDVAEAILESSFLLRKRLLECCTNLDRFKTFGTESLLKGCASWTDPSGIEFTRAIQSNSAIAMKTKTTRLIPFLLGRPSAYLREKSF